LALIWYEGFVVSRPLLHPYLFRQIRTFTALLVVAFVAGMLFYALQSWYPVFLTNVYARNEVDVGIWMMPFNAGINVGGIGGSLLLPVVSPRIGTRPILTFGVLMPFIFIPLMCIPSINQQWLATTFASLGGVGESLHLCNGEKRRLDLDIFKVLIHEAGIGLIELTVIILTQLAIDDEWIGFATGSLGLVRAMGGSTGTAIYTAIFHTKAEQLVPEYVAESASKAGLDASLVPDVLTNLQASTLSTMQGLTPDLVETLQDTAREAYRHSFRYIWLSSIAFGALAVLCALATKDVSVTKTKSA
jgi:hypothetical protein